MSFEDCIIAAAKESGSEADRERAEEMVRWHRAYHRQHRLELGDAEAERVAAEKTLQAAKKKTADTKRRKKLAAIAQHRIDQDLDKPRSAVRGRRDLHLSQAALIGRVPNAKGARVVSWEDIRDEVFGTASQMMADVLRRHSRNLAGMTRRKALVDDWVRELGGVGSGTPAAKEMAEAVRATVRYLRHRANKAGAEIGDLDDYIMPQTHHAGRVREAGFDTWKKSLKLDRAKMVDRETGLALSDEELDAVLKEVFDSITTGGANKITPGAQGRGRALASTLSSERVLHFASPDDWLAYNKQFGNADPWNTLLAHIDNMSRDVALLERFGPNPRAGMEYAKQRAMQLAAERDRGNKRARHAPRASSGNKALDRLADVATGGANVAENEVVAYTFGTTRTLLTAAQLGNAMISATTDVGFQVITTKFNGLSWTRTFGRQLKLMTPGGGGLIRQRALRSSLVADGYLHHASSMARYTAELPMNEVARRMADGVLKASLLQPWTQAGRWAFGMEFMGAIADYVDQGRSFDRLPGGMQRAFARYGMDAQRWEQLKRVGVHEDQGARMLRISDIADDELRGLYAAMIQTEQEFATPSGLLRGKSILTSGRPGTAGGEVVRSASMYRSFTVTLTMTHGMRMASMLAQRETVGLGLAYLGAFFVLTTLGGGVATQLKEIARGRDPMPMNTSEFWMRAMMQGGGFGFFGDFLFSDLNRYGRNLSTEIAGPLAAFAGDLTALGLDARDDVIDPQEDSVRSLERAVDLARRYAPDTWYTQLPLQRALLDQLDFLVDAGADDTFERRQRSQQRDYGNAYWWAPGEATPRRAPQPSPPVEE